MIAPMATIYYDTNGDPVAIAGYGNQGSAQAQNLRDSGLVVIVGNIEDEYTHTARADGFVVLPIADAVARADVVFLLTPDEVMPEVYAREMQAALPMTQWEVQTRRAFRIGDAAPPTRG